MPAGVYMIRNPVTGESYIGASCDLEARISGWKSCITKHRRKHYYTDCFDGAFDGLSTDEIEFRILEFVEVPPSQKCRLNSYRNATPAVRRLIERETYWIDRLKPALNVRGNRSVDISKLPVGEPGVNPDDMVAHR